jgi:lipoprotein-anchoring transpeptidase ErfK/SrfK/predicted negative regulator of RcsB-dependent stress response
MARNRTVTVTVVLVLLGAGAAFVYHGLRLKQWRADYARGVRLFDAKEYARASGPLQVVYNTRPNSSEGLDALCRVCVSMEETGRADQAIESWEKVLASPETRSFHPQATLALARAAVRNKRLGDANRYLDAFLRDYPDSPLKADALTMRAEILEKEGDLAGALGAAREAALASPGVVRGKPGDLFIRALLSRTITPGTQEYTVGAGDSLQSIAKRAGTTVELLRQMNGKDPGRDTLRVGDRLKVCAQQFSIVVDKSDNTLLLLADDRPAKLYSVGTGKKGSTPTGDFRITLKQEKPEWFRPGGGVIPYGDPGNLLGTRWMAIDAPGYGIHGTWEPETIGKQLSAGCVRMLNSDVEELYTIVPVGTPVKIVE